MSYGKYSSAINDNIVGIKEYVWTDKIETILKIIRENSTYLSKYHNYKYQCYKKRLNYYRIPIIVLSAVNAFFAVGLQTYVQQPTISTLNSVMSLVCGIITSIELFLNIQKNMENDLLSHKDYYLLSLDIFKMLSIDRNKRIVDGRAYLDEKFADFQKYVQNSNVVDNNLTTDIDVIQEHITNIEKNGKIEFNPEKHEEKESWSKQFLGKFQKVYDNELYHISKNKKETTNSIQKYCNSPSQYEENENNYQIQQIRNFDKIYICPYCNNRLTSIHPASNILVCSNCDYNYDINYMSRGFQEPARIAEILKPPSWQKEKEMSPQNKDFLQTHRVRFAAPESPTRQPSDSPTIIPPDSPRREIQPPVTNDSFDININAVVEENINTVV
jgi:transcription elongation factor Elf1